jgi:tRNA pseudouridine38-40 synthase
MARYQVILAYDGTDFFGFQRQAINIQQRTVQQVVETALRRLGWQGEALLASGRTDTGVHASGQVIAFDLHWTHGPERLLAALNAHLPPDVAAQAVRPAADDFHPRYDARLRRYRYRLFCHPVRDPLRERFAWRVWPPVDGELLSQAAAYLPGSHDFAAFGTPPRPRGATLRTVVEAAWQREGEDGWQFTVAANAFLYHMVRRMVGFQVLIGQGLRSPEMVGQRLERPSGEPVNSLAPPNGLTLAEVQYEDTWFEKGI